MRDFLLAVHELLPVLLGVAGLTLLALILDARSDGKW